MNDKWQIYFMDIAKRTSEMSKDPITKVGAVFAKDKHILSIGFNGAPSAFPDELVPSDEGEAILDKKNTYMCHAELNAVLNYNGHLKDLNDSTLYVTVCPCTKCSLILSQLKIKNVIYLKDYRRKEENDAAKYIMDKCGINYKKYSEDENEN